jgi:predicted nuclease of restriction endonuclease-like (RecB) superfamily
MPADLPAPPGGYDDFLRDLKDRIHTAQVRAALSVNRELVRLYWQIGRDITARQAEQGWGQAVIRRLAADLQSAFPGIEGFSPRNLERMRAFFLAYPDEDGFATQPVSQIPWGHNIALFQKLKDLAPRLWYAQQTLEHGWSRAVLEHQIETNLYARQGQAVTNFAQTLPAPQSDLARQLLKDPYTFDFLTLGQDAQERDLERGLLLHLRDFLLELGVGFAFVGSQYPLAVGGDDFYIDLLFYHLHLHCYVVVDLKMGKFTPADAGQMNFYLSAVDDLVRRPPDGPTLGIILCKTKNRAVAQYALRDLAKPLGVAEYQLPDSLQNALPALDTLERALTEAEEGTLADGVEEAEE